ncbi:hypothetical protein SISNIDRAFT_491869 [Sistotremastrum niveocremeum HHB9708]|uniref:BTB domain-containing protein n=1 Tax=Sistotremastrum niveocremeum HHB9708 TaxID=1314777 RepID=A0A164MAX8_9AGAM|nr:hypothetical protein SISNIDRAFT_491869 [Sistotremastrum niveocremeum HHB9708]
MPLNDGPEWDPMSTRERHPSANASFPGTGYILSQTPARVSHASSENPAVQRHPCYYTQNPILIFRVENMLFKVAIKQFANISPVFRDLMDLGGSGSQEDGEGLSDDNPIVTQDSLRSWELFVPWVERENDPKMKPDTCSDWLELLAFAHKYQVKDCVNECIAALNALNLSPAHRLSLAMQMDITQWVGAAIWDLLTMPQQNMTLEDYRRLSIEILFNVHQGRDKIRIWNSALLCNVFPVHHGPDCIEKMRCERSWKAAYTDIMRAKFHPDKPMGGAEILLILEHSYITGMGQFCFSRTIEELKGKNSVLRDETIAEEEKLAIARLCGFDAIDLTPFF